MVAESGNAEVKSAFIDWLVCAEELRRVAGLPLSEAAFAEANGVTARTLRRWKGDPKFQDAWAVAEKVAALPVARPVAGAGVAAGDEGQYQAIKESLAVRAGEGDGKALETWMRYWGKSFAEAEKARRESSFAEYSDDELTDSTLALIGVDRVREWLLRVAG